jgi:hypothetical protein
VLGLGLGLVVALGCGLVGVETASVHALEARLGYSASCQRVEGREVT